ncbi:hypothetical protein MMC30_007713 [Trapelia coarctata]|nr:hypothetical protein [Trapelia coarctata]
MPGAMEQYTYVPLSFDGEADTIRVIEIQAGNVQDALSCTIKHVRLADGPQYEALSYCWGDPTPNQVVYCEGKPLAIATSLYLALCRLRRQSVSRTLWADAICINQHDVKERNQQVRLMRQIYENAQQVVIWLGEEADDSHLGLSLVPKLLAAYGKRESTGDRRTYMQLQDGGMAAIYDLPQRRLGREFPALSQIFKRPWFQRGWIVQEVAVAKASFVQCGASVVGFDDLVKCIVFVNFDLRMSEEFDYDNVNRLVRLGLTRMAFQQGWPQSLFMLLLRHCTSLTTDPRDKIYSFMGMAANAGTTGYVGREGLEVKPDYNTSVEDVYRDLAMRMLSRERTLAILYVPRDPNSTTKLNLPSWVPDLSASTETASLLGVEHNFKHTVLYQAAGDSQCHPQFSENNTLLGLSGFIVDTITKTEETASIAQGKDTASSYVDIISSSFRDRKRAHDWRSMAGLLSRSTYITGERLQEAFWKTLIAGWTPGHEVSPERRQKLYRTWLRQTRRQMYLRLLPWPLFEIFLCLGMAVEMGWRMFRLCCCLLFWTPKEDFGEMMGCFANRRLIKTSKGYIGLAYDAVRVGDSIAVCQGGRLPLVVRREWKRWRLMGDCYVHGIMLGEVFAEEKCETMWFV